MDLHKLPIRLILSVIAGIAVAMALSIATHEVLHLTYIFPQLGKPMFDKRLLLISLAYHSLYAVIGAYITARIAQRQAKKAAFILGSKEAVMWLLGAFLLWPHAAPWYNFTKAILGIPLALLGGWIYTWHKIRKVQKM